MKKVFLTALFAVGALFNGTAQNQIQPIPGTNFQIYKGDGFTNILNTNVTRVATGGYNYNSTGVGLRFTINKNGFYTGFYSIAPNNPQAAPDRAYDVQVIGMYDYDKSTVFSFTGSRLNIASGDLSFGNSQQRIYDIRTASTLLIKMTDPTDDSYVVYAVDIVGGDKIVKLIDELMSNNSNNNGSDPFGGGGGVTKSDPFDTALDVDTYVENYAPLAINPFDLRAYLDVFIGDAKVNYGLDFSYIFDYEVDLEFSVTGFDRLEESVIAYTDALGDDKRVHIVVNAARWNEASPLKKLMIFYHELGHDILNLEHVADEGPLMSVYAPGDVTIDQFLKLRHQMFTNYTLQN